MQNAFRCMSKNEKVFLAGLLYITMTKPHLISFSLIHIQYVIIKVYIYNISQTRGSKSHKTVRCIH